MSETLLNSVGLIVFTAALAMASAWFLSSRKARAAKDQKTQDRIAELESKLALVNQAVIPISTAFQAILIRELTHYHTPEMDGLMKKIGPPNTLTEAEEHRLTILLKERTQDMGSEITPSERDAAAILPMVMKRARIEADTLAGAEALKLRLVTVAAVVGLPINVAAETERDA